MIVDTSAVVAIFMKEPGHEELTRKLVATGKAAMGAPTLVETGIVLSVRLRTDARPVLARFLQQLAIGTVPFGELHWQEATSAWLRYGKGRHPASLNFGDCMSYATARLADAPLLCKGDDFPQTDLRLA